MIDREIKTYGAILLAVLLLGFVSWRIDQRPNRPHAAAAITVLDIDPTDLAKVELSDATTETTVSWKGEGKDRYSWVDVKHLVVGTAAAPAPESFPGGDGGKALLGRYSPLTAIRKIGPPAPAQQKEMALDTSKTTLSVATASGRTRTFKVGGSPFGSGDLFAQADSGDVYLIPSIAIQPLQGGASGLTERTLSALDDGEIAQVTVSAGQREIEYTQQLRQDRVKRYWARPKTPDKKEEQFATWLGKARHLPIAKYPPVTPGAPEPEAKVKIVFKDEGGREIGRIEVAPGKVKSDRTKVWADTVPARADEVLGDVEAIVGAT